MIEPIENLKIGIIGGGQRCKTLLEAVFNDPDADRRPKIAAVADTDDHAAGLIYARGKGIFTTTDFRDLFLIEDLEVILELTGDDRLKTVIKAVKPPGVLLVDHYEARALLDRLRIKAKMNDTLRGLSGGESRTLAADALIREFHRFVSQINDQANAYARQSRETLLANETTLSQIINGSPIATFVLGGDHNVTHWNRACEQLTGTAADAVLGTDRHWKPFWPEKRPTMADLILDGAEDETLWRLYASTWRRCDLIEGAFESEGFFPHLGADGAWLFFTAAPIRNQHGAIIGAIETLQDRTRQKQAEIERERQNTELAAMISELRHSRQALSQIIKGSTIPTFVIDEKHIVTHWNKALERLSGHGAETMVGTNKQWLPFYDKQRPSMADVIMDQLGETQMRRLYGDRWRQSALIDGGWEAEAFFPKLGENGKWCWFTAAPIKAPDGRVVGAIETLWDKTEERKAAAEQERHTQALAVFCSIYATLSGPLTLEDRINTAIREMADIFQLDAACIFLLQSDGRFHLRHSHGYSDSLCFQNRVADEHGLLMQSVREKQTKLYDCLPECGDNEVSLLRGAGLASALYIPIFSREKKAIAVIRVSGKAADLFKTDHVRTLELIANRIGVAIENSLLEEDIKRRVDFQARLISSANDGIVATDSQWRVVIFNPAAQDIFGHAGGAVIDAMDARDLFPASVVEAFEALNTADAGHGGALPWREATLVSAHSESIPARFCGSVLREKHKIIGRVVFFQDLREIKRLEKELLDAERLAAIGQTVAGMAHCIKNILHGFKGGSYILDQGIEKNDPDKLSSGWRMVQRNITRTADLVQDLLSYAKAREPEPEACAPNAIVTDVCDLMRPTALEHAVTLTQSLSPEIETAVLDQRSLHRSLMNLISNAIDACRDDDRPGKTHWVRVATALEDKAWIRFSVQDNGPGMSDDVKARLFTSFFSTKGVQGTGLGLLVTRKLIEEHQGRVDVDSRPGQGATFTIRLPLVRPDLSHAPDTA